jgi:hypothetical protein
MSKDVDPRLLDKAHDQLISQTARRLASARQAAKAAEDAERARKAAEARRSGR